MGLRNVTIDKTARIEELMNDHPAVCLSGMPGTGKKTAVRVLLEKHPEINSIPCSVDEIEDGSALKKRVKGTGNWYLVRKPEDGRCPEENTGFRNFIRKMSGDDRILLAVDGLIPENFLELIWSGVMAVVMPETFWFTEVETWKYLKKCRSRLRYREVYYLTGGWAGCIAMMVRLEKQLSDRWTARELGSRYEIRGYIQRQILSALPEDELRVLRERAAFPSLNGELASVLWKDSAKEPEEHLFVRGAMVYEPARNSWHVQPALRMAMDEYASPELCEKAVAWYEEKGQIQNALTCCRYLQDRGKYIRCLIGNYDSIPFLDYEKAGVAGEAEKSPELMYLEWMEYFLHQDTEGMAELRKKIGSLAERAVSAGADRDKVTEICVNIAYSDPWLSTAGWMDLLREKTEPGRPVRLYFMLGESVSYLSGVRDLSELFACGKKERDAYRRLWEERLSESNQIQYRLAELEYELLTDGALKMKSHGLEAIPEKSRGATWQVRLGMMYLAYLLLSEDDRNENISRYLDEMKESLEEEEDPVCRWNTQALYCLAGVRMGNKERLLKWIRDTGGDIENDAGKSRFYMSAEVKINLYLGDYNRAGDILQLLIPYYEKNHSWKWLAESLFQRAIVEKEKGETGQALKTVAESFAVSNPYRYVRIYTGYGRQGAELLTEYERWIDKTESSYHQNKKKYKYGSVLRMPVLDWTDYIVRKAGRRKKHYVDLREEQQDICRAEKLTATEQMVLQYLEKGYSNARISESMNIKLSTVKTHIYNIYKKLGVTTRIQAVRKIKESGEL